MLKGDTTVLLNSGDAEIAGLDIAGLDSDGLDISGRVCESELGNMLSF